MFALSRRDFLKSLTAAAVALSLDPFRGVSVDANVYSNARLGLSVVKPTGWEFESIADFVATRERQILYGTFGDLPHRFKDPASLPTFVFEDPEHRRGHWGPGIVLFDALAGWRPPNDVDAHKLMLLDFRAAYKKVRVIAKPEPLVLNGAIGTHSKWQYLHELDTGEAQLLRVRSLLVFRAERAHTFHLVDYARSACVPKATFETFIDSIRYQPL